MRRLHDGEERSDGRKPILIVSPLLAAVKYPLRFRRQHTSRSLGGFTRSSEWPYEHGNAVHHPGDRVSSCSLIRRKHVATDYRLSRNGNPMSGEVLGYALTAVLVLAAIGMIVAIAVEARRK